MGHRRVVQVLRRQTMITTMNLSMARTCFMMVHNKLSYAINTYFNLHETKWI